MIHVVGVDEVGRGCWAGPLVAAAVRLHEPVDGLRDSKKLSSKQRETLAQKIKTSGYVGTGWVTAAKIDEIGLTKAVEMAMNMAVKQLGHYGGCPIIVDGDINYLADFPASRAIIKADSLEPAVSAASIVAKVERDSYMRQMALNYPGYGFEKHVGYGTQMHKEGLKRLGLTPLHRRSFRPVREMAT